MKNVDNLVSKKIADTMINEGYAENNVIPLQCVLSGSRAYGFNTKDSDYDFIGLHIMDSWYCFEHPDFQPRLQVVQSKFDEDFELMPDGINNSYLSLDSFELWKFYSLWKNGAFYSYELIYNPSIHFDESIGYLFFLMKEGTTNKIYYPTKSLFLKWASSTNKTVKRTLFVAYKLLQTIHFLNGEGYNIHIGDIPYVQFKNINNLLEKYINGSIDKNETIKEKNIINEIEYLVQLLDNSRTTTRLFDKCPQKIDIAIRQYMIKMRGTLI